MTIDGHTCPKLSRKPKIDPDARVGVSPLAQKLTKPQQKPSEHGITKVAQTIAEAVIMPYKNASDRAKFGHAKIHTDTRIPAAASVSAVT
ncbi:MAG: hypothetical protein LBK41_01535 [Clostridiales bacterium]|jgi:hypothetical protein|nr:hypothetical protein [Clostridiales bacterium]